MRLLLFFICFLLFFVGFHNIDLSVNVLILDPIRFWAGSDCSLLVCSGYPSIYRMGNFMQFIGFFGLVLLSLGSEKFQNDPCQTQAKGGKDNCPQQKDRAIDCHKIEEKAKIGYDP